MISPSSVFSTQIRDAITESGMHLSSIAREAKLSTSLLSRFINGKGGLSIQALDRLAKVLGFRVVPVHDWQLRSDVFRRYENGDLISVEISVD